MKNIISLVISGAIGGCLSLGAAYVFIPQSTQTTIQVNSNEYPSNSSSLGKAVRNTGEQKNPTSFVNAAEKTMHAVVSITSTTEYKARNRREQRLYEYFGTPSPSEATGSGVIISNKGYIVTNNHVIKGATKVEVVLNDNRKYTADVIGKDPSTDLAVLKISAPNLPILELADSDKAKVGQWVLAVGNPFELTSTVTAGIISAKGRDISILNGQYSIESFIQTDAAVNPGNSGGALVNTAGELVGINTAIYAPTGTYAGYSFAVPINLVKKVVQDLIEYGEVKRAFLGIMIQDVNSEIAKRLDLSTSEGIYISELIEGGAALKSGIKTGDIILKINDIKTTSVPALQEQIGSRNPGDSIVVTVNRKGTNKDIIVKLSN